MFLSKLPDVGTNIFTLMTALANEYQAVNLAQGFPNYDCHPALKNWVIQAIEMGKNQYAPMAGLPELRTAIAQKMQRCYNATYDADTEITITAGGTQAIFTALAAVVQPTDEVVLIEPAYDCYEPAIRTCGGKAVFVPMVVDAATQCFEYDWAAVAAAITPRTRAIVINTPHNPTGKMLTQQDIAALEALVQTYPNLTLISDEVYEHIIFDHVPHRSLCQSDILRPRTFVISSFGKTYHSTGWKVGYCLAPPYHTAEFRKVHQFNVFCVNTPMQYAYSQILSDAAHYETLPDFYETKRNYFKKMMQPTPFKLLPCAGTYFQLADYSEISQQPDYEFAQWLTKNVGVATIPVSAFYKNIDTSQKLVRFCFAKTNDTLEQATEKMAVYFK